MEDGHASRPVVRRGGLGVEARRQEKGGRKKRNDTDECAHGTYSYRVEDLVPDLKAACSRSNRPHLIADSLHRRPRQRGDGGHRNGLLHAEVYLGRAVEAVCAGGRG